MKHIIIALLVMLVVSSAFTQTQEKTYTVKESQLTAQQKAELTVQQQKENVGSWVGLGKEVGTAMKEGLSALNSEVNKFSESPAGQFTMFVIAYKVIGNDAFHFVIGFPLLVVGFCVWVFFYYRNCVTRRIAIKVSGTLFSRQKEYSVVNENNNNTNMNRWGHFAGLVVFLLICSIVLFSGGCNGFAK